MTTAREIMSPSPRIVSADMSIRDIARTLREDRIGAVVVCDSGRLQGLVTDRDVAVEVVAADRDASQTTAADILSNRETVTIGADDDLQEAIRTMSQYAVRRLPVIDGQTVVGVVSQADIARHASDQELASMVRSVSQADDNSGEG